MKRFFFIPFILLLFVMLTCCSSDILVTDRADEPDSAADTADEPIWRY